MNNKNQNDRNYRGPLQVPIVQKQEDRAEPPKEVKAVPKHRQCPICFGGMGGVGHATGIYRKSSTYAKRYYACDKCGHSWSVELQPSQVIENEG